MSWTKEFVKTVNPKDTSIIHIIRHPLASINSPIRAWLTFQNGDSFFPKELHFQLNLVFICREFKKENKLKSKSERLRKRTTRP